ncbi:MAG: hypothetical protein HKP25_04955 [Marinicaulis sp.]|nr:hypothetical protein [Marinicaulis sp.]
MEVDIDADGDNAARYITGANLKRVKVNSALRLSGDRNPKKKTKSLDNTHLVTGLIYGLVNVRADGKRILCATMNKKTAIGDP